ncbi:MAG: hypothetical protein IT178_18330 [Acidobacteria bacterium]|nr:hypothetical protein [Acidobacteriota bacterium]
MLRATEDKPSRAPSSAPPFLPPAIKQFFLSGGGSLTPALLGVARVSYADAKLGIDDTRVVSVVTPIGEGAVAVDWDHAEPADFDVEHLDTRAPADVGFAALPSAAANPKSYATWEKDFSRWAAASQSVEVLRSAQTKLISQLDESERDFRIRLGHSQREARDAALQKVRDKYASRVRTAEDKLRRAQQAVQRESQQASESKMSAAVSFGATVLGALLGRKTVSASTLGRATTAARSASRVSRESQDVARAEATVSVLEQQLAEAHAAMEADLATVQSELDPAADTLERVVVKPKRGGVSVQLVGLVWK